MYTGFYCRIVELSETYTRLIQKGSGVGVFDAFSHIMDSIQVRTFTLFVSHFSQPSVL